MSKKSKETKLKFTQKNSRNYFRLFEKKRDLFHITFGYLDTSDRLMEKIMELRGITGEIKREVINPNNPYHVFFIRCRKKDSDRFRYEIFPKLHHKMAHKLGNDYLNYCEYFFDVLENGEEQ